MVQGVTVCGTFVTKKTLIIIAVITLLVLVLGCILLGVGLAMYCYYDYDNYYYNYDDGCIYTQMSLIINGGVLIGFSVITLVTVSVMACRLREAPVHPTPTIAVHPYVMPGHAVVMPQTSIVYNQANPGYPQQHLPAAATTTATSSYYLQQSPTTIPNPQQGSHYPQKHPSQTTATTDLLSTSSP